MKRDVKEMAHQRSNSHDYSVTKYRILCVFSLGPKGVINDWRRFKLESMDQENLPPAKKELLRQMSSPNKPKDDSRANLNRKVEPRASSKDG